MKDIVLDYAFDASEKTITFNKLSKIDLERILLITNVTDSIIIYNPYKTALKGSVSSNVLALQYDTTGMSDNDDIQIFYDFPVSKIGVGLGALTTFSNVFDDFTATVNNAAKTITLSGMPSILSEALAAAPLAMFNLEVHYKKTGQNTWNVLPYTSVTYSTNVLTFTGIDNFATGDSVVVLIQGPMKGYDAGANTFMVEEQNVLGDADNNMMGVIRKPVNSAAYDLTTYKNTGASTAANIEATPAAIMEFYFWNNSDADAYFQIHNKASAPSGGDTAVLSFKVPGNTYFPCPADFYQRCSLGPAFAISSTDDTYTAGLTASDFKTIIRYKL